MSETATVTTGPAPDAVTSADSTADTQAIVAQTAPVSDGGEQTTSDDFDLGVFSFTEDDAKEGATTNNADESAAEGEAENNNGANEAYDVTWSETSAIPEFARAGIADLAKQAGVPADKAGSLFEGALAHFQSEVDKVNKELGRELKAEWGDNFGRRVDSAKQLMARVAAKAGLSPQECAPLMGPHGIRFMHAVRELMGEPGGYAGNGSAARAMSPSEQVDAIMNDPKQLAIMSDPSHPQYRALNAKVNKLLGI